MMATSIGAHDKSMATIGSDVHALLDPHTAQIKIDCFRVHLMHWVKYSSGWQILQSLLSSGHQLHIWALPIELLAAVSTFVTLVMLEKRDMRTKAGLSMSALAHCSLPSSWIVWLLFASLFLSHFDSEKVHRPPLLPVFVPKGRKPSRPFQGGGLDTARIHHLSTAALGLFLLSANFYGYGLIIFQARDFQLTLV